MPKETPDYSAYVLRCIIEKAGPQKREITLESRLKEDVGLDSLDAVELTQDLEDHYKKQIPDEVVSTWKIGNDIVAYLQDPSKYLSSRQVQLKPTQP